MSKLNYQRPLPPIPSPSAAKNSGSRIEGMAAFDMLDTEEKELEDLEQMQENSLKLVKDVDVEHTEGFVIDLNADVELQLDQSQSNPIQSQSNPNPIPIQSQSNPNPIRFNQSSVCRGEGEAHFFEDDPELLNELKELHGDEGDETERGECVFFGSLFFSP